MCILCFCPTAHNQIYSPHMNDSESEVCLLRENLISKHTLQGQKTVASHLSLTVVLQVGLLRIVSNGLWSVITQKDDT